LTEPQYLAAAAEAAYAGGIELGAVPTGKPWPQMTQALREGCDAVVMLTVSDWLSEPRSNRYHYATRFARLAPVIFVQPDRLGPGYSLEASGYPEIDLLHVSQRFGDEQTNSIANALTDRKILKPLLWTYSGYYGGVVDRLFSLFRVLHATEDYFSDELRPLPEFFEGLERILPRLDLLVAVTEGVLRSWREAGYRGNALVLENGCDFEFFQRSREAAGRLPKRRRNVVFYQGGINYRLDYALLRGLTAALPDWEFWFCGVRARDDGAWQQIARRSNVRDLGVLTPEGLARRSWQATVGLIPFVQTPLMIDKSLPLKAFEYVACELPVVTVPIRSLARWPDIFTFATTAGEFAAAIKQVAPTVADPLLIERRREVSASQDWNTRFTRLIAEIGNSGTSAPAGFRPLNILLLYASDSVVTATVFEHVSSFARFTRHRVYFAHGVVNAPCNYDMAAFDVVIVHYSVRLIHPDHISPHVVEALRRCGSFKVLFIQDEYENTEQARRWLDRIGFHAVFTCVPGGQASKVYPPERFPSTEFLPTLTGYVPEALQRSAVCAPLAERPIVLGYRARDLPYRFGHLGQEKIEIGRQMRALCEERGIPVDIQWTEETRIYGTAWYDFIARCRAMLGSESGSNIFDEDGSLTRAIEVALQRRPKPGYAEIHARFLAEKEGWVRMNQVSPRVFEAAALRTALVLFEGEYSGVVRPIEHYLPLKKDFSNADWVLQQLQDLPALERMVDRTYRDVIASGRYSYRHFIAEFEDWLDRRVVGRKPRVLQTRVCGARRSDAAHAEPQALIGDAVGWPLLRNEFIEATTAAATDDAVATEAPVTPVREIRVTRVDITTVATRSLADELARRTALEILDRVPIAARPRLARGMRFARRRLAPFLLRFLRHRSRAENPSEQGSQ
jgi:hypothetical protein